MPDYLRDFVTTTPPGSRPAKEIDDAMREMKVDFYERLMTALFTTFGEDKTIPAELLPIVSGKVTDRVLVFGPQILKSIADEDDVQTIDEYVQLDINSASMRGTIPIPVGYTIKKFEAWADINTAASVTVNFKVVDPSTGTVTSLTGNLVRSTAGLGVLTSAALAHVVVNPSHFVVHCFGGALGRPRIYGFRITYDKPADNRLGY